MDKKIANCAIIYLILGLFFAIGFALFYHWGARAFFSPGFYIVILTWPFQIPGFVSDFQLYGFAGKVLF